MKRTHGVGRYTSVIPEAPGLQPWGAVTDRSSRKPDRSGCAETGAEGARPACARQGRLGQFYRREGARQRTKHWTSLACWAGTRQVLWRLWERSACSSRLMTRCTTRVTSPGPARIASFMSWMSVSSGTSRSAWITPRPPPPCR